LSIQKKILKFRVKNGSLLQHGAIYYKRTRVKSTEVLFLKEYYRYRDFIEGCRQKKYSGELVLHLHHILPKHLETELPDKANTVYLSVDDHINAHLLLAECFTEGSYERLSNIRSAKLLSKNSIKELHLLKELSKFSKGVNNPFFGKKHTEETKQVLREATIRNRREISYEEYYGDKAVEEKEKRAVGVKKVWDNRSEEERSVISKKIKQAKANFNTSGGNNYNAKVIYVDGIKYPSVEDAKKELNKSRYRLFKEHKITS
jgi:hypothetical protein